MCDKGNLPQVGEVRFELHVPGYQGIALVVRGWQGTYYLGN